jgi:hypothetical protein
MNFAVASIGKYSTSTSKEATQNCADSVGENGIKGKQEPRSVVQKVQGKGDCIFKLHIKMLRAVFAVSQ